MTCANTRVLIVDDEEGYTQLLRFNLERSGSFEVCEVTESTHAVSAAREFQPDIILLDVVMPGLDGEEIASLFKKESMLKDTPVLFLTALVGNPELGEDGSAYMVKTTSLSKLVDCIRRHVENSPARNRPSPPHE